MAAKQNRPQARASDAPGDPPELLIGHEIDEFFSVITHKRITELITTYAAKLNLTLSDDSILTMAHINTIDMMARIFGQLTEEQHHEVDQIHDIDERQEWFRQNVPNSDEIIAEESGKVVKRLEMLALLQNTTYYGKTNTSMEFDAPPITSIVEQAQAEAQHPQIREHPAPDTVTELGTIAASASSLHDALAELREQDLPLTRTEAETAIAGLHAITTRSEDTKWRLGLHAVERGLISQVRLAELIDSSSASVSRRYNEHTKEPKE